MPYTTLPMPDDPQAARSMIEEASLDGDVLVLKKSPICPISFAAEAEFREFLGSLPEDSDLRVALIDVIEQKSLARGLTDVLGVRHESPQALYFHRGELHWHDSHDRLTVEAFAQLPG